MGMRKTTLMLAFTAFFVVGLACEPVLADVVGMYGMVYKSKASAKGFGGEKDVGSGVLELKGDSTWEFTDNGSGFSYSGTYSLIKDGKKIHLVLTAQGRQELMDMLIDWAVDAAASEGVTLTDVSVSFEVLKLKDVSVNKKTGWPKKVKLSIKGMLSATIQGLPISTKFKYAVKLEAVSKL